MTTTPPPEVAPEPAPEPPATDGVSSVAIVVSFVLGLVVVGAVGVIAIVIVSAKVRDPHIATMLVTQIITLTGMIITAIGTVLVAVNIKKVKHSLNSRFDEMRAMSRKEAVQDERDAVAKLAADAKVPPAQA